MDEAIKRQVHFKAYAATEAAATYLHGGARYSDPRNVSDQPSGCGGFRLGVVVPDPGALLRLGGKLAVARA